MRVLAYNAQMQLDKIFNAFDIRGRIDNGELDEGVAEAIGAAFASFVGTSDRSFSPGRLCAAHTVRPMDLTRI